MFIHPASPGASVYTMEVQRLKRSWMQITGQDWTASVRHQGIVVQVARLLLWPAEMLRHRHLSICVLDGIGRSGFDRVYARPAQELLPRRPPCGVLCIDLGWEG